MVHCLCECHYSLDCNDAKDEIIRLKYTKYIINKCVHTKSISQQQSYLLFFLQVYNKDVNVVVADGDAFDDEDDIYHGDDGGDAIVANGDGDVIVANGDGDV